MDYVRWMNVVNGQSQEYHETDVLTTGLFSPLLDLLNVRYIVVPAEVPPSRPDLLHMSLRYPTIYVDSTVRIVENTAALPRAWVVFATDTAPFDQAIEQLNAGDVDPRRTVLLDAETPSMPVERSTPPGPASATLRHYEPDHLRYQAISPQPGYLVISEPYDPGWRAYLDGKPVHLLRADGMLRAVQIPSGTHDVELRYEPPALRVGIAITLATITLWLLALIFTTRYHWRRSTRLAKRSRSGRYWHRPNPRPDARRLDSIAVAGNASSTIGPTSKQKNGALVHPEPINNARSRRIRSTEFLFGPDSSLRTGSEVVPP
jgi:hypothetical protein